MTMTHAQIVAGLRALGSNAPVVREAIEQLEQLHEAFGLLKTELALVSVRRQDAEAAEKKLTLDLRECADQRDRLLKRSAGAPA
jgi:hypothetical protein